MSNRKPKDDDPNGFPQQAGQFYPNAQFAPGQGQFPSSEQQFGLQPEFDDTGVVDQSKNKTYDSNNQSAPADSKATRRQQAQALKKQKEEDKERQKMLKESKKQE